MLFSTAKVPQKAFIVDLYYGFYRLQCVLYYEDYQCVTNDKFEKSLYYGVLWVILVYMKKIYIEN